MKKNIEIVSSLCSHLAGALRMVKSFHSYAIKAGISMDSCLGKAILNTYRELNFVEAAKRVFNQLKNHDDVASWNILIAAAASSERMKHVAWEIFLRMQDLIVEPNGHTIISILASYQDDSDLKMDRSVHGYAIRNGIEIDIYH